MEWTIVVAILGLYLAGGEDPAPRWMMPAYLESKRCERFDCLAVIIAIFGSRSANKKGGLGRLLRWGC
jgi:hypothetical protein